MPQNPTPKSYTWVTVTQAAKVLNTSRKTVYRWVNEGKVLHKGKPVLVAMEGNNIVTVELQKDTDESQNATGTPRNDIDGLQMEVNQLKAQVRNLQHSVGILFTMVSVSVRGQVYK